jgi:hypothetical protein
VPRGDHLAVIFEAVEVTGISAPATTVSGVVACVPSTPASLLATVLWFAATSIAAAAVARISAPAAISAPATASVGIPAAVSTSTASVRIAPSISSPAAARVRIAACVPPAAAASVGITTAISAAPTGVRIAARIATATTGIGVASATSRTTSGVCGAGIRRSSDTTTASPLRIEVDSETRPGQGQSPDKRRHVRQSARHRYILSHYETTSLVNGHNLCLLRGDGTLDVKRGEFSRQMPRRQLIGICSFGREGPGAPWNLGAPGDAKRLRSRRGSDL